VTDLFFYVPDDAVTPPVLLGEAVEDMAMIAPPVADTDELDAIGGIVGLAWMWTISGLANGQAEAFAQSKLTRRWARIPRSYWKGRGAGEQAVAQLETSDPELRGQPIAIRRHGLEETLKLFFDFLSTLNGSGPSGGTRPAARKRGGWKLPKPYAANLTALFKKHHNELASQQTRVGRARVIKANWKAGWGACPGDARILDARWGEYLNSPDAQVVGVDLQELRNRLCNN